MKVKQTLSNKNILFIGFMLFSLFFGAGNLIFPPELGQNAGDHLASAMIGFLISGVGLPFLGVLAIAYASNKGSTEDLSKKVHPVFAVILTSVTYLTVGPLFAAPRTGVVSYEIGVVPFLSDKDNTLTLAIFTIIYFLIVYVLALNPGKFVDRIGKLITPFLLAILFFLIAGAIFNPFNMPESPSAEFMKYPLFKGITEGYLTMDTIVSIVFGMIIVHAIRDNGVIEKRNIQLVIWKAGVIAIVCLSLVYVGLGYLGATSSSFSFSSGAGILSGVSREYFGVYGNIALGLAISLACIPTATGLLSSCALYFNKLFPSLSYKTLLLLLVVFSAVVANIGLDQLIELSVPVLQMIYPVIIVLIALTFSDKIFKGKEFVYRGAVILTIIVSVNDGLSVINENWDFISLFIHLPFNDIGFGWVLPALLGGIFGWVLSFMKKKSY